MGFEGIDGSVLGVMKTLEAVRPAIHEEGIVPSRRPLTVAIEPAQ